MGRPSLKKQRTAEILDAYEACVIRYGVEGATLERVAAEAGIARPLIRHHIGNRDSLLSALVERFRNVSQHQLQELVAYLPEKGRSAALIDLLFDEAYTDTNMTRLAQALLSAAAERSDLADYLRAWTNRFMGMIRTELQGDYPRAGDEDIDTVVAGITGIYFNVDSFAPLGAFDQLRRSSKAAVFRLMDSLR